MDRFDDRDDRNDRDRLDALEGMDRRILWALPACGADPRVGGAARALSWAGEHGALWLAAGLAGAAVDGARRGAWLRGARAVPPLAAAMCLSRQVVGVHHPSDVAVGAALGALTACAGARWVRGGACD